MQLTRWVTLKEVARWITVKHMNHLLTLLPDGWQSLSFSELIKGSTVKLDTVKTTMTAPPRMLTNLPFKHSDIRVLSEGSMLGLGVTMQQLPNTTKPTILIVDRLSPDLVKYFPMINGILATDGSQLSHLAIMAREHSVPVHVMPHAFTYVGKGIDLP
jgi:phosphohistidine swiveling domain-containing protein